jgi:hypothetical protein
MLVAQQGRETSPTLRLTLPNCPWQLPGRPHPLVKFHYVVLVSTGQWPTLPAGPTKKK